MKHYILSLFIILSIVQCSNRLDDDITSVVLSYNNALAVGYRSGSTENIKSLVTPEQLALIREKYTYYSRLKLRYIATLRSIIVSEITQVSPDTVKVITEESWDYHLIEPGKGGKRSKFSIRFKSSYDIEKYNDGWVVAEVAAYPYEDFSLNHDYGIPPIPVHISMPDSNADLKKVLKETVITYITLLADGYTKQDMSFLVHSATQKRAMKAYHHMSSMGEGGVRMEPNLRSVEIGDAILLPGMAALVQTQEEWDYTYYSTKTGEKVFSNNVRYTLTYELIRNKTDRWLVDNIHIDYMEEGSGKGELPFFSRPHEKIEND